MHLIITGCEYAGKRSLGVEIARWWSEQVGGEFHPPPACSFHDHFTVPHVVHAQGHEHHKDISEKEILGLNPGLLEHFQRFQIEYHFGRGFVSGPDHWNIDWYYADAVFAPLYYGYGRPGEYADRRAMVRHLDEEVMEVMPDAILVLMKAAPEVIRKRKRAGISPYPDRHKGSLFKERDISFVLDRFQEEFDNSLIKQRFSLDTSTATVEETLEEFKAKVEHYLTSEDRQRMADHQATQAA